MKKIIETQILQESNLTTQNIMDNLDIDKPPVYIFKISLQPHIQEPLPLNRGVYFASFVDNYEENSKLEKMISSYLVFKGVRMDKAWNLILVSDEEFQRISTEVARVFKHIPVSGGIRIIKQFDKYKMALEIYSFIKIILNER